ncbi:MAG: sortase [Porcipelethomonas sp.]
MKSKVGITFMILGTMLIAAALSLAVYNIYTDKRAGELSGRTLTELEQEITGRASQDVNAGSDVSENEAVPVVIDDREYIGVIGVPVLGIELPVMKEWSYDNLKISPCRYSGSITEGSLIIAGHNYSEHFGRLKNLNISDEVYFIDTNGEKYDFEVAETELISGNDPERMNSGEWSLTLFTCNFDGSERVTIRCDIK